MQRSRGESLSESQPRSPISIIWHDSWQQEQPIRRTCRYIHSEWCVGWLFLFHHPCLLGLSPVWVHRPARSETRYQYRTVGYTVVSALSGRLSPRTRRRKSSSAVRGGRVSVQQGRDLSLDNPRPVHQSGQCTTYSRLPWRCRPTLPISVTPRPNRAEYGQRPVRSRHTRRLETYTSSVFNSVLHRRQH